MKNKNYWKLLKNRNWAFLVVCCFTWDLKFVSNILFMIVMRHIVKNKHNRPSVLHLKGHIDSTFNMLYEGLCLLQQFRAEHEANLFACRLGRKIVKYTEFQNLPGWYLDYVQVRTKALTVTRLFFGSKRKKNARYTILSSCKSNWNVNEKAYLMLRCCICANPSRPVHFRKLYYNQNQLKFLISHFIVVAFIKTFWGTTKKYQSKNLS